MNGDEAEESGTQTAEVSQRVFLMFAVRWKVDACLGLAAAIVPVEWVWRRLTYGRPI